MRNFQDWCQKRINETTSSNDEHAWSILQLLSNRLNEYLDYFAKYPAYNAKSEYEEVITQLETMLPDPYRHLLDSIRDNFSQIMDIASRYKVDDSRQYQQEVAPIVNQTSQIVQKLVDKFELTSSPKGLSQQPAFQQHISAFEKGYPYGALTNRAFNRYNMPSYIDDYKRNSTSNQGSGFMPKYQDDGPLVQHDIYDR